MTGLDLEMTARETEANPRVETERSLDARRAALARLERQDSALSNARLAAFVIGVIAVWPAPVAAVLAFAAFAVLVVAHGRTSRARQKAARAVAFHERSIARQAGTWAGGGNPGDGFREDEHPYAADLDLFGRGSLFELLDTTRTRAGEATLAAWLRAPAPPEEIRARQDAVRELAQGPRVGLREDLAVLGADVRANINPEALAAWASAPPVTVAPIISWLAVVLPVLAFASLAAWFVGAARISLFFGILILEGLLAWRIRHRVARTIEAVDRKGHDLTLLAELLQRLEREHWSAPRLRAATESLRLAGEAASERIRRLSRLIHLLEPRLNQFFAPFAAVMFWSFHFGMAIERWRLEHGRAIAQWLAAVGELEAFCSLAAYAYENPSDAYPDISDASDPTFDAEGLGHPLLGTDGGVRNDIRLGGADAPRCLIVSGSNMSGKSTLLRSVGINAVLAQAGAPVRAERLSLSPLIPGATLRIQDSLQAGRSRFAAELARLKVLSTLAEGPLPLLFLLDEILHGTNSHDRRIGAEALIRQFLDRGAIGLVTTHDLSLTEIAETLAPEVANVHFADHFEDGEMRFDYRMQPGIVLRSNALALMRSIGLDV